MCTSLGRGYIHVEVAWLGATTLKRLVDGLTDPVDSLSICDWRCMNDKMRGTTLLEQDLRVVEENPISPSSPPNPLIGLIGTICICFLGWQDFWSGILVFVFGFVLINTGLNSQGWQEKDFISKVVWQPTKWATNRKHYEVEKLIQRAVTTIRK